MKIATVVSTKGGPGKTTVTANPGAFCADSNLRTLLIDLDTQPSLSSFYRLDHEAPGGTYQLIAKNETRSSQVISRTCIPNLSLILSNDPFNQLSNPLLHAVDGRGLAVTITWECFDKALPMWKHLIPCLEGFDYSSLHRSSTLANNPVMVWPRLVGRPAYNARRFMNCSLTFIDINQQAADQFANLLPNIIQAVDLREPQTERPAVSCTIFSFPSKQRRGAFLQAGQGPWRYVTHFETHVVVISHICRVIPQVDMNQGLGAETACSVVTEESDLERQMRRSFTLALGC